LKYYFPAIAWLLISTVLLLLPGSAFPKEDWLDKIWFDKWVHVGMFLVMTVLWFRAPHKNSKTDAKPAILATQVALAVLFYGVVMELVQHRFIPNRSFDAGDIAADAAGCAMGAIFAVKWLQKNRPL